MAINFSLSKTNNSHFAQVIGSNQPKFLIGKETIYQQTKHGLINLTVSNNLVYDAEKYKQEYKFWAYFIAPTAAAESKNSFLCLNTYDRAKFTFGFMQYGAHVANGDFVKFFKELLALPNAKEYFPKLVLKDKRIFYRENTGAMTQLEDDRTTEGLMNYLNPSLENIENQELICAGRFVHWASNDSKHRSLQVKIAVEHFKKNMQTYAESYNLDGFPAKVCQVICDIRHQGRAKSVDIINAINTRGNFELAYSKLLQLGQPLYTSRIATVRSVIKKLSDAGVFNKKYKQATNEFV